MGVDFSRLPIIEEENKDVVDNTTPSTGVDFSKLPIVMTEQEKAQEETAKTMEKPFSLDEAKKAINDSYKSSITAIDAKHNAGIKAIEELGLDENQNELARLQLDAKTKKAKEEETLSFIDKIQNKNLLELVTGEEYKPKEKVKTKKPEENAWEQNGQIETAIVDPISGLIGMATSPIKAMLLETSAYLGGEAAIKTGEGAKEIYKMTTDKDFDKEYPMISTVLDTGLGIYGAYKAGKLTSTNVFEFIDDVADYIPKKVKNIAEVAGMSRDELEEIIKDVPKEEWAKVVAQSGGAKTAGLLSGGIQWDTTQTGKAIYMDEMTARVNAVKESIGGKDFKSYKEASRFEYESMKDMVEALAINPKQKYDPSFIIGKLEGMSKQIGTDTVVGRLKIAAQDLADKTDGYYTLKDLIDLKEEANFEWGKASPQDRSKIKAFKDSVDEFINKNIGDDEKLLKLVNDATDSYSIMKTTEKALEILDKATAGSALGAKKGEALVTDWNTAYKLLEKEFEHIARDPKLLDKYESIKSAFKLTERFKNKFGSIEAELFGVTKQISESSGVGKDKLVGVTPMLATARASTNALFEFVMLNMPTNRGSRLRMEKAISKSIAQSKTQEEFLRNIIDNPNTTDVVKRRTAENLSKFYSDIADAPLPEAVKATGGDLGMSKNYGGKPTYRNQTRSIEDYADRLFNRPKEKEEFINEVNRFGITGSDKPTKANNNAQAGAREWFDSLTNKQKEQVVEIVEKERDLSSGYGLNDLYKENLNKATKSKQGTASYTDVSDSLFGTKTKTEVDKSGNLGMTSDYGGKATGTGGVNNAEAKKQLNEFMDDIANPKVEINQEYVSKMYSSLKDEEKLMYGFSAEKKKAYAKLRQTISELSKKGSKMKASDVDKVKKDIEDYLKHFD